MADQRLYVVFGTGDGATVVTEALPWTPVATPNATAANFRYRTAGTAAQGVTFGLFPPAILGRTSTNSLVRVYVEDPQVGDVVQVVSSGVVNESSPLLSARGLPVPLTNGPKSATILELDMTDWLKVTTSRAVALHIEVLDLDEEQHLKWLLAKYDTDAGCCGDTLPSIQSLSLEVGDEIEVLPVFASDILVVDVTATNQNAVVRLPPLINVAVGKMVHVHRNPGVERFVLDANLDGINGSTNPIRFNHEALNLYILRGPNGWVATTPAPDDVAPIAVAGSAALPVPVQLRTRILWTLSVADVDLLTLPDIARVGVGQEFEVTISALVQPTALGGMVIPTAGQRIDRLVDERVPLTRAGDTALFRATVDGWISLTNGNPVHRNLEAITADPGLAASTGWHGLRTFAASYAANGDFTLPTAPRNGTPILFVRRSAATVALQGGTSTIVVKGTAGTSYASVLNEPILLTFFNTAGGKFWIAAS